MDETAALRETVHVLLQEISPFLHEILIIVCRRTAPPALAVCHELAAAHPLLIQVRFQHKPFLGGAMQDGFNWATGSHILMMSSDLETQPSSAKHLIAKAREGFDIVTATRWTTPDAFSGYHALKRILNWSFQKFFAALYGVHFTDMTFGYRIFKTDLVKSIRWVELRHPFLLESLVKPLRLGASVAEIPTTWTARAEGESHNPFWRNFSYFCPAIGARFAARQSLLKSTPL